MQENFYIKKVYYGAYVKNIILPMSAILNNKRNEIGIKNLGINNKKLRNSTIRTKTKLIHKAYHNFYNSKVLSFVTLTYAKNMQDINKAKHDIAIFFKRLKRWWNNPKRVKYLGELKYMYVYEYQKRGAIHFHILFNRKIHKSMLPQWWPFGFNDVRVVKKGTNENIVKYLSKYVVKVQNDIKSQNQYDLGVRAYAFSRNCSNPKVVKGQKIMLYQRLIDASINALHTQFFKKKIDNLGRTILFGGSFDTTVFGDNFKDYDEYISIDSIRFRNAIKRVPRILHLH
ncbi:rolling circle replication-associated protein [Spiroplasma endosymbiont of Lasioglossum villosulum]|uniref:rolling circle replication-associated protein n=1 Tax=Spiroplasma endosymbiont of Lasioglossum villosulum TaxID=3066320 RepID=UPI0030CC6459